jgi:anti-anti-sigma factor
MAVEVSFADDASDKRRQTLSVSGDLDMSTAGLLREHLNAGEKADEVVIDLSQVEFMDSTGLAVVVGAARDMNGGVRRRLRVIGAQPPVANVFEAAGLADILED